MRLLLASCSGGLVGLRRLGGLLRIAGSSSLGMARVLNIENVDQVISLVYRLLSFLVTVINL